MKNRPSQSHKYRFRLQKEDKICKYFMIFSNMSVKSNPKLEKSLIFEEKSFSTHIQSCKTSKNIIFLAYKHPHTHKICFGLKNSFFFRFFNFSEHDRE